MAGGTNFEGIDHARLKAMVANSDPGKVLDRAGKLRAAGRLLEELGKALSVHLGQIEWEGAAAEGFKKWATDLNKSAVSIGEYSRQVGETMSQAGEVLSSVKAGMPTVPTSDIAAVDKHAKQPAAVKQAGGVAGFVFGFGGGEAAADKIANAVNGDWVTDSEAKAAQKRVYAAHQEAIHQLEKLGQAYVAATTKLNSLQEPQLPAPPGSGPGSQFEGEEVPIGGGGPSGSGGSIRNPRGGGGDLDTYTPPKGRGDDDRGGSVPPPPRTPLPEGPGANPVPTRPTPQLPGEPPITTMPWPGTMPPGTNLNSLPPTVVDPVLPPTNAGPGGQPPFGPGGPGPLTPSVPGGPGGPGPFVPGPLPTMTGGGQTNPVKNGPNSNAQNRGGPVFGSKEAGQSTGRATNTGMGMGGMHPGMGMGGGTTGAGARGRGLTSTGGGVVGGRKGPAAGGEFTPGGSGLRRNAGPEGGARNTPGGMMGAPMGGSAERRERERRQRADYLHEDEETWTNGTPRSNPGVVE